MQINIFWNLGLFFSESVLRMVFSFRWLMGLVLGVIIAREIYPSAR